MAATGPGWALPVASCWVLLDHPPWALANKYEGGTETPPPFPFLSSLPERSGEGLDGLNGKGDQIAQHP